MKPKWKKAEIFLGRLTMWHCEEYNIEILRDNRNNSLGSDPTYPYVLNVGREYHGNYRLLSVAKKDAILFATGEKK